MSYCEIIYFQDGKPVAGQEFKNAHGGAAFIWSALSKRYLGHDNWMMAGVLNEGRALWDLAKRQDLSVFERAVHAATFDRAIVRREDFTQFAADLRKFVETYPPRDRVCHLLSWASAVESSEHEAIGFYMMSVSDNLWFGRDEDDKDSDESIPYNLNEQNEHFEVYDYLAKTEKSE